MKRLMGLDLIKTIAVLFVVSVHFFLQTDFYEVPVSGKNMVIQIALRWIFTICVPLFLLITGYLQKDKEFEKSYFKKIVPILGVYLFYSVLSIIIRITYLGETKGLFQWIAEIMTFTADKYSWYVNMYLGLFMLIPFLNMIHRGFKSSRDYRVFLGILILLTSVPGFVRPLSSATGAAKMLFFSDWWTRLYPLTYYFLGAYIREYQFKFNKLYAGIGFFGVLFVETFLTFWFSRNRTFVDVVGDYGSILIMIKAVALFIILYDTDIKNRYLRGILSIVSILSLDIYLASYVSDKLVYKFVMGNIFKSQQQIIFYLVFIVLASFSVALTIAYIRYKAVRLPVVKGSSINAGMK